MNNGEITFDFQQESGYRISITFHFGKLLIAYFKNSTEVAQQCLTLKDIGILIQTSKSLLLIIILIVNLTHDFFQDILQGNDTTGTAELIYNDSNMHLVLLEFTEQVVNLLRFRNEVWRTDQTLPAECGRFTKMWQ